MEMECSKKYILLISESTFTGQTKLLSLRLYTHKDRKNNKCR